VTRQRPDADLQRLGVPRRPVRIPGRRRRPCPTHCRTGRVRVDRETLTHLHAGDLGEFAAAELGSGGVPGRRRRGGDPRRAGHLVPPRNRQARRRRRVQNGYGLVTQRRARSRRRPLTDRAQTLSALQRSVERVLCLRPVLPSPRPGALTGHREHRAAGADRTTPRLVGGAAVRVVSHDQPSQHVRGSRSPSDHPRAPC